MHFEHLVQINDPQLPLLDPLTREQLWHGLVRRAEQPTEFILALESCHIVGRRAHGDATVLERNLDFGPFQVRDEVTLHPFQEMATLAQGTARWPTSRMVIRIEEPEPQILFLRFTYDTEDRADADALDAMALELRRQAYVSADLDTVQRIRELASAGLLD